jgi:hypothetical protein
VAGVRCLREAEFTSAVLFRQEVFSDSCFFRLTSVWETAFAVFPFRRRGANLSFASPVRQQVFSPYRLLLETVALSATGFLQGGGLCILRFVSSRRFYLFDTVRFRSFGRRRSGGATCFQTPPRSTPFFRAAAKVFGRLEFLGFLTARGRSGSTSERYESPLAMGVRAGLERTPPNEARSRPERSRKEDGMKWKDSWIERQPLRITGISGGHAGTRPVRLRVFGRLPFLGAHAYDAALGARENERTDASRRMGCARLCSAG